MRKTLRPLVPGSLFLALVATCFAAAPAAPMIATPVPVAFEVAPAAVGQPNLIERYGPGFNPKSGTGDIELWLPIKG